MNKYKLLPPDLLGKSGLEQVFTNQQLFVDILIEKGKMPIPPLDLTNSKGQKVIRDLVGFYVEELLETYQAYELLLELKEPKDVDSVDRSKIDDQLYSGVKNINAEMADCVALLTEILLYSRVKPSSIFYYVKKIMDDEGIKDGYFFEDDALRTMLALCRFKNIKWGAYQLGAGRKNILPLSDELALQAGRCVYSHLSDGLRILVFNCIDSVYRALMLLKKKPWREAGEETDIAIYQEELIVAYFNMMTLMDFLGWDYKGMIYNFYLKTLKNCERQEEGY